MGRIFGRSEKKMLDHLEEGDVAETVGNESVQKHPSCYLMPVYFLT